MTGVDPLGGPHGTVTATDSATVDLLQPETPPAAARPPSQIAVLGETQVQDALRALKFGI